VTDRISQPASVRPRDILVLLSAIAFLLAGAEVLARRVAIRASRIERRVDQELTAAPAVSGPKTVLFAGNSLMLYALRDTVVPSLVPEGWRAGRLTVEQTSFLDWKYGLRELWRRGARPAVIALMLNPGQLTGNQTRRDYTAMRMLGASDVIAFGREADMHPTEISRLVLSHYSTFYGFRSESRKVLLGRLIPGMDGLAAVFLRGSTPAVDTLRMRSVAAERLRLLAAEVRSRGSQFVLLLPPGLGDQSPLRAVVAAATDAGVRVVVPDAARPYSEADFFDGFHVSPTGAARYEHDTRTALLPMLSKRD
jgi:hypothetical protein